MITTQEIFNYILNNMFAYPVIIIGAMIVAILTMLKM